MSRERVCGNVEPPRDEFKPWFVTAVSVLGSAVAVAAVGLFCALIYPILKDLRAERVSGQSEERMLGFWSILVLALLAGCICWVLSWTLTYLDSQHPGETMSSCLPLMSSFRDATELGFNTNYCAAALNGFMAAITVIWSLS